MAPAVLILAALTIVPAGYLLYSSFFDFTLLGTTPRQFTGLDNYEFVFTNGTIRHDLLITFAFVAIAVSIEMVLGLLIAVPLARRTTSNSIASTLLLIPFAMTPAVSAIIWRVLLDPNFGWVDYYLTKVGIMSSPVEWLSHPGTAWVALVGLDVWQWTPFVALVLMAGLQGVDEEPRQAAAVDGATRWQQFRYITLPLLAPFIAIALLLRVVEAFKTFATVNVLTGGGPGRSTELINLTIYRVALQDFSIGAAAALGIVFLLLLLLIVPQILRLVTRHTDVLEAR
ncbi:MAG: multiple sugar transport system permease protein [Thermoleophilaceae bacterium]|nr:multiple sugar transport system permease protein [Thermoleophilaceae bacterium]